MSEASEAAELAAECDVRAAAARYVDVAMTALAELAKTSKRASVRIQAADRILQWANGGAPGQGLQALGDGGGESGAAGGGSAPNAVSRALPTGLVRAEVLGSRTVAELDEAAARMRERMAAARMRSK